MHIGYFEATDGGYIGHLRTLTLEIELILVPTEASDVENAPDFRVLAGPAHETCEIGAGWKHIGDKAGEYVAILLDDPMFDHPLRANLFQADNGGHVLVWSRQSRREMMN